MNDIKYIYFELYVENASKPKIQNENILFLKPDTNSSGYWGYRNVTERRKMNSVSDYIVVHQYWVDFTKYELRKNINTSPNGENYHLWIKNTLEKLKNKLRKEKLKEIIFEE